MRGGSSMHLEQGLYLLGRNAVEFVNDIKRLIRIAALIV